MFRANYEGDVGLHVAKAIWGVEEKVKSQVKSDNELLHTLKEIGKGMTPPARAKFLGDGYVRGSKAYDEDED